MEQIQLEIDVKEKEKFVLSVEKENQMGRDTKFLVKKVEKSFK